VGDAVKVKTTRGHIWWASITLTADRPGAALIVQPFAQQGVSLRKRAVYPEQIMAFIANKTQKAA
jgi:hypothetical protein